MTVTLKQASTYGFEKYVAVAVPIGMSSPFESFATLSKTKMIREIHGCFVLLLKLASISVAVSAAPKFVALD